MQGMAQSPPQTTPPWENWSFTPEEHKPRQFSPCEYWQAETRPWDSKGLLEEEPSN
jgi:hypothetical protein